MIQALQLILALSFLVVIHELGHFTFAKIFHVRVEKFYMFFNPWISLIRAKKFNGRWHFAFFSKNLPMTVKDSEGERPMTEAELAALPEDDWRRYPDNTEWGIGWLPFGGYCAIGGMVDETHKTEDLAAEPQPWEFRSKPAWQRLLIILGGILVNFIAALVIFSIVLWTWGKDEMPLRNVDSGLYYSELLQQEGFRQQDKILSIDGQEPQELGDVVQAPHHRGPSRRTRAARHRYGPAFVCPRTSANATWLSRTTSTAPNVRKRVRTIITSARDISLSRSMCPLSSTPSCPTTSATWPVCNVAIALFVSTPPTADARPRCKTRLRLHPLDTIEIGYYRNGQYRTTRTLLGDQCKLGVIMRPKYEFFRVDHTDYTFFQAIPAGIQYGWDMLTMYVKQFRLVFTKEGAQSLGGFEPIGQMFPSFWDWYAFWHMTAFLSLILAFMNFLPIPALDGGYILFLLVEMITRRKPSDKFLERANEVGFWLLIALLVLANGNDILKIFF